MGISSSKASVLAMEKAKVSILVLLELTLQRSFKFR